MAEKTPPRTSDALRHEIDEGHTGDKVGFADPAAAPLGTDDEAAGTPPTPEQIARAEAAEVPRPDGPSASDVRRPVSAETERRGGARSSAIWVAVAAVVVLVLVLWMF